MRTVASVPPPPHHLVQAMKEIQAKRLTSEAYAQNRRDEVDRSAQRRNGSPAA